MWFRKRSDQALEPRPAAPEFMRSTDVDLPPELRPTPYAAADVAAIKPAGFNGSGGHGVGLNGSSAPTDLRVWYRQTDQVKPSRRRLARSKVISIDAPSQVYLPYNLLRTQVLKRLQENDWTTVAITSPLAHTGTTLTAINLAISIARDPNYSVLLVELNLVSPAFCKIFGLKPRPGIADHLLRDVPVADTMFNPGVDRLVMIPGGSPVNISSELLSSPKMVRLVEELKLRYQPRVILFDLPPVLASDDTMAFSPLADCALLVVEEGETRVSDVRRSLDYLGSTSILGVVMNRSMHVENDGKIVYR